MYLINLDKIMNIINRITIDIGIINFIDYFPLLKRGQALIKTIECLIKCHNMIHDELILPIDMHEADENTYIRYHEHECYFAEELFDIIYSYKCPSHKIQIFEGKKIIRKNIYEIFLDKTLPELDIFILYMCLISNADLYIKIIQNKYVRLAHNIYKQHRMKIGISNIYTILNKVDINKIDFDLRSENNIIYRFAKFCGHVETCNEIKEFVIKQNWIEKQVLINNIEPLIGPSDIPNNIFDYMRQFI